MEKLEAQRLMTAHLYNSHLLGSYGVQDSMLDLGIKLSKSFLPALLKKLLWVRVAREGLQEGADLKVMCLSG